MRSVFHRVGYRLVVGVTVSAGAIACAQSSTVPPPSHPAPVHVTAPVLTDAEFAPAVLDLLSDGEAVAGRTAHIASAVHYLLGRAQGYFDQGLPQIALDTVTGALFLARVAELHPKSLSGFSLVLVNAADVASRRGDEGRSRALYELAQTAGDGSNAAAVRRAADHLDALDLWEKATQSDGAMQAVASRRLGLVKRALLRREGPIVDEAEKSIVQWIERAIEINRADAPIESMFDHDERVAARLAFLTGAQTMIALYLRDGNAAGALGALDSDVMAAITEPRWVTLLISASEGNTEAWMDWFRLYQSALEQPEFFDSDLARAAQWGIAVELARSEKNSTIAALPLLTLLPQLGMPDVGPAVLASRARGGKERPSAEEVQARRAAVGLMYASLERLARRNELALARSVFDGMAPVLETWATHTEQNSKAPSAIDFYETLGALEVRNGQLERALPLLTKASKARPSVDTLRILTTIERQRGQLPRALTLGKQMQELASNQQLPIAESQARVLMYDTLFELGRTNEAAEMLQGTLEQLLALRQKPATPRFAAAVERSLAQVLERYGELDAARRANERARAASKSDEAQLSDVLLDESRRALTFGELSHGRLALRHALEANLEGSTLIYAALWQYLLELRVKAASDGTVEEALGRVVSESGWPGALAQWGAGQLTDEQLTSRARSEPERVEARFYVAMKQYVQGSESPPNTALALVAKSPAIDLIEVRIARDLTSKGAATGARPSLPQGVLLP